MQGTPPVTGLPGAAPGIGLPVFASTLAATASQMGFSSSQASNSPPGMSDGPKRAPSSPPDTPEPMKRRFFSRSAFSRRMVSVQSALPPSITMSPASSSGTSPSMTASVALPAWTRMIIFRGRASDATNSGSVFVPTSPPGVPGWSATNLSVFSVVRLKTEIWKPWSAMFSARF